MRSCSIALPLKISEVYELTGFSLLSNGEPPAGHQKKWFSDATLEKKVVVVKVQVYLFSKPVLSETPK